MKKKIKEVEETGVKKLGYPEVTVDGN